MHPTEAIRRALAAAALALAAACTSTDEDPMDPTTRLAELDAQAAAPVTATELEAARAYISGWIVALRDPLPLAESNWLRRAGQPPTPKVLAALVETRDECLGAFSPRGLPGVYLVRLTKGGDRRPLEPAVLELLRDPDPDWRVYGCEVLAHWPSDRAHPELVPMLDDGHPTVALAAASALAQRGDPTGLPLLLDAAREWSDADAPGPLPFRHHFARFANADFQDDFEAYDAWFTRYPVWED